MKSENFLFRVQKNYSDTDAAAAGAAAASTVCTVHVIIEGGFAPLYKYMVQYIQQKQQQKQQKQQRQQQQNLFCQLIQLNIHLPVDVKGPNMPPTP